MHIEWHRSLWQGGAASVCITAQIHDLLMTLHYQLSGPSLLLSPMALISALSLCSNASTGSNFLSLQNLQEYSNLLDENLLAAMLESLDERRRSESLLQHLLGSILMVGLESFSLGCF